MLRYTGQRNLGKPMTPRNCLEFECVGTDLESTAPVGLAMEVAAQSPVPWDPFHLP